MYIYVCVSCMEYGDVDDGPLTVVAHPEINYIALIINADIPAAPYAVCAPPYDLLEVNADSRRVRVVVVPAGLLVVIPSFHRSLVGCEADRDIFSNIVVAAV